MLVQDKHQHNSQLVKQARKSTWRAEGALYFHTNGIDSVITQHQMKSDNTLSVGQLVTLDEAASMLRRLRDKVALGQEASAQIDKGWADPRTVFDNASCLVWENAPQLRDLWFSGDRGSRVKITAKMPRLIFALNRQRRTLSLFACSSKGRVTATTKLYVAPLMNTSETGAFCLGNATLPDDLNGNLTQLMNACEGCVFDSVFTHTNTGKTFKNKGGVSNQKHISIWSQLAKEGRSPTLNELIPASVSTLHDFLKHKAV